MANEKLKKALREAAEKEFLNITDENVEWEPSDKFLSETGKIVLPPKRRKVVPFRRLLVAAAVTLFIASAAAVLTSASIRESIIATIKEYHDTYFDLEYDVDGGNDDPVDAVPGPDSDVGALAEIYVLEGLPQKFNKKESVVTDHSVISSWESGDGEVFILQQGDGLTKRAVDTERLEFSAVKTDKMNFEAYTEEGYVLLMWVTDKYTFSVDYYGELNAFEVADVVERCLVKE